ncbi:hypothetical protein ACIB24_00425 [Spongisporangium articulatum]|uniref:Secreted protein n=1 Tax=Spongisporangium articulatum TaxID=3362603 RepID=A0ABW8AGR0_9ACTN
MASILSFLGALYMASVIVILSSLTQIGTGMIIIALVAGLALLVHDRSSRRATAPEPVVRPSEALAIELAEEPSERPMPTQRTPQSERELEQVR